MAAAPTALGTGPIPPRERALVAVLFLLASLPVALTANDYGVTYDEPHYISAGAKYAAWAARVARGDFGAVSGHQIREVWRLNHEHPPLQKLASGFAQRWFAPMLPGLTAARLPSALRLALVACAIYLFSRGLWGRRGALFSALALLTMPRVVAHAHFVALDMPIAAWFFVAAALLAVGMERNSWGWALLGGGAWGLALLAKMNAFFLPLLLLPWALLWHRRASLKLLVALALVGPAVFYLGWPWLWLAPVAHLRGYLGFHLEHAAYNVWYRGELHEYAPWHYPFVLTAVTTPPLLLALAGAGLVRSWPRPGVHPRAALLLLGLVITIAPSTFPTSPKYNGVRLFLPAFPFLAAVAGGGFAWLDYRLTARLLRRPGGTRLSPLASAAIGAALLLPGARAALATHPYQLAYYNALAAGTAGATDRGFETIYWGQVYREAPAFLNHVPEHSPLVLVIPVGCIYLLEVQQQAGALRSDIRFTGNELEAAAADYVLFQCMQSDYTDLCWALVGGSEPAWAVRLGDTPLLVAYGRASVADALARLARASAPPRPLSPLAATSEMNRPTR